MKSAVASYVKRAKRLLLLGVSLMTSANAAPPRNPTAEEILAHFGSAFIDRANEVILQNIANESNVGILEEIKTGIATMSAPLPGRLATNLKVQVPDEVLVETLREVLKNGKTESILQRALIDVDTGRANGNANLFRKGANLAFGVALLWGSRFEYTIQEVPNPISEDFLYGVIEKIGRLERSQLAVNNTPVEGPIFTAAYRMRFQQLRRVQDYYYLYAAILSIVKAKYKGRPGELSPFLARHLYDVLVYGMQLTSENKKGEFTFFPEFEEYFPSFEKHFPFHEVLAIRYFGELGFVRDQFKKDGNTRMVDQLTKLRLQLLSRTPAINPSCTERFMLTIWGGLTDWGTSAVRILKIGAILTLLLFATALHGEVTSRIPPADCWFMNSREYVRGKALSDAFGKVVSYSTLRSVDQLKEPSADRAFAIAYFVYYSLLLAAVVAFMVRHS